MSAITGPSLAGGTLYVLTVLVFTWITRQPCIRHDYYTYTTLLLYRHRIRFVVSSDVPLNPACGRSAIGAERPILIPSTYMYTDVGCRNVVKHVSLMEGFLSARRCWPPSLSPTLPCRCFFCLRYAAPMKWKPIC